MNKLSQEQSQTIETEIHPLQVRAASLVVRNPEERALLVSDVEQAEGLKKRIEERFHPTANRKAADEARDAARDTEKAFYDPIDAFVKNAKVAVRTFDTEEAKRVQRERDDAEAKRLQKEKDDAAAKQAAIDAEDARILADAAELQRQKDAAQKIKDDAIDAGNTKLAGIAGKEVSKLAGKIENVMEEGQKKIDTLKTAAEEPPAPPMRFQPPPTPIKKLVWKARPTNMIALARSVAAGVVPFNVLDVRVSALNDFAKTYDGKSRVEGLEFYQESTGRL